MFQSEVCSSGCFGVCSLVSFKVLCVPVSVSVCSMFQCVFQCVSFVEACVPVCSVFLSLRINQHSVFHCVLSVCFSVF